MNRGSVMAALVLCSVTADAHHSYDATYDLTQEVALNGTLIQALIRNPHSFLHLEVQDKDGNTQRWALELPGANSLRKHGLERETLKSGDEIAVTVNPGRKPSPARGVLITLLRESDGFTWRAKAPRHSK
jgi:hypothetical protein